MSTQTIEERLAAVETELQQLIAAAKREETETKKEAEEPRGWKGIVGIFTDDPEFEEAVRAGKEWRDSFRQPDYEETS